MSLGEGRVNHLLRSLYEGRSGRGYLAQLPGRDKGSETHQVFGTWSGRLRTDDGLELELAGIQGFAEEARQEW